MADNKLKAEILKDPLRILKAKIVLHVLKKHWLDNHENLSNPKEFVREFFHYLENAAEQGGFSNREIKKFYNKKLKEYWKEGLPKENSGDMFLEILQGESGNVETVLDFGCGKLAFLKNMADENKGIKKFIGIDSKSQPVLEDLDSRIEFTRSLDDIPNLSVDLIVIKLVLHHLNSNQEAQKIFVDFRRVLRPGGKLVVFEESFSDSEIKVEEIEKCLAEFNLEMTGTTKDFLDLSREEKIQFLFLNDWLMNVQNSYMPWTGLYKSMEEWRALVESTGFQQKESHFLGAIKHRKRKQGMTAMFVF